LFDPIIIDCKTIPYSGIMYNKNLMEEFNALVTKKSSISRNVKFYADQLAISTKKLNSITKMFYGITTKKFIDDKIISESKKKLLNSYDTVRQISYSMGFTDPTNFNKYFKKQTSQTPLQYRNQFIKGSF
jgi:AraC family transcriptional regulator, transcriptional activator of pobA